MLRIENINMSAGDFSVNNISLSIPDGSCHVLLGGTGNGKTLILESIAGLKTITDGEIWVDEYNITKEPPEKRFISYVPQDLALFPHLNVEKNIFYSQRFKKNHSRTKNEINDMIESMQLKNILHRSVHYLSGGEQQRVALVRAFASGNKVLLLDEPFSALDFTMKRVMWGLLSDIQKKYNLSILMVTHDLDEACFLSDYVSVLHQGTILQTGKKEDVFNNPSSVEVTKITGHYNYLSGNILEVDESHSVVSLDDMPCMKILVKNSKLTPGEKVIMAIRTSKIEILPYDSVSSNLSNTMVCQIKNIYETIHYQQIVVTLNNQNDKIKDDIIIDVYDRKSFTRFEKGQTVTVCFPADEIYIFKN